MDRCRMRPRIRTLKPEIWADEKVGDLSHGARLLYVGLITMADDEGRLRELPAAIVGHIFPYDNVSAPKAGRWLAEIANSKMIVRYVVEGKRYLALSGWAEHQRVERANKSELPPPPADFGDPSVINHRSVGDDAQPPAQARGPFLSDPDPCCFSVDARATDPPDGFPDELRPHLDAAFRVLSALAERHRAKAVTRLSLGSVVMARPRKPLVRSALDYAAWADGKAQRRRDVVAGYRNWLDKQDDLAGVERIADSDVSTVEARFGEYDRAAGL